MFQKIKKSLPNVPDEVLHLWLVPIAEGGYGWPPPEYDLGKWRYVLALKSLDYWNKVRWEKIKHRFDNASIFAMTDNPLIGSSVAGIIEAHTQQKTNAFSNLVDGKARFFSLVEYVLEHRTLPAPPIILQSTKGLEIIDGNHRLAALTHARSLIEDTAKNASPSQKGRVQIYDEHDAWKAIAPNEGDYTPNPLSAHQEAVTRRQWEQLRISRAGWWSCKSAQ